MSKIIVVSSVIFNLQCYSVVNCNNERMITDVMGNCVINVDVMDYWFNHCYRRSINTCSFGNGTDTDYSAACSK
jgi:hypothetical protein